MGLTPFEKESNYPPMMGRNFKDTSLKNHTLKINY